MECKQCNTPCIKFGKQANGTQRYRCRSCGKCQQKDYVYQAYLPGAKKTFHFFMKRGVNLSAIAEYLQISKSSAQRWLEKHLNTKAKFRFIPGDQYEIDEMHTYIGNKQNECWIMYTLSRTTGNVINLIVGRRTKANLKILIDQLLLLGASKIYTDRLQMFKHLIPKNIHIKGKRRNQIIERKNLNLRKDLSRLIRKTICFSKSKRMLEAHLRLYFLG